MSFYRTSNEFQGYTHSDKGLRILRYTSYPYFILRIFRLNDIRSDDDEVLLKISYQIIFIELQKLIT